MANDQAKQLLQDGIIAARAGQQAQARQLLQEAVKRDPQSEQAWLWLSSVAKDDKERIFCLKQLLAINPNNDNAIKGLRQLGIGGEAEPPAAPKPTIRRLGSSPSDQPAPPMQPAAPVPPSQPAQQPGVPMVDDQRLAASMAQLDPILQRYRPIPTAELPFQWAHKKRGRVGDASAMLLRGAVAGAVLVVVLLILGGGLLVASNMSGGSIALFSTPTPSHTPTPTLTPTPGLTDTPSPTPRATLEPSETPGEKIHHGDINNREATAIYPPVASSRIVKDALDLAAQGNYTDAINKLGGELKALENAKNDDYYAIVYYSAQLYVDSGNPERAVAFLNGNKVNNPSWHAAMGYALYAQKDFDNAFTEADTALKADKNLSLAALTASRILTAKGSFTDARRYLNLALEGQPDNVPLLVERGQTLLVEEKYKEAEADALLAQYIDPLSRDAYILRIQALLAEAKNVSAPDARVQAFGTAVLAVKDFLLYYPSETISWLLLGQAREGEGNIDEALNAYSQAVVSDTKSPDAQQVFIARGKLYLKQKQYQKASDDFDKAILIGESTDALQGRYQASLGMQNYKAAVADAQKLVKLNPDNTALQLDYAQLLIQNQDFVQALPILNDKFINGLNKDEKPTGLLYRGIVKFTTADKPETAPGLDDLNEALSARESGLGHYYRGQIYELLQRPEDAIADYQWVEYWNNLYQYPFIDDVRSRLDKLGSALPTPSPTSTPRSTDTPTRTSTPSKTPRVTPTLTPTDDNVATDAATDVATDTATAKVTSTATKTATLTRTPTKTPKP